MLSIFSSESGLREKKTLGMKSKHKEVDLLRDLDIRHYRVIVPNYPSSKTGNLNMVKRMNYLGKV